MEQGGCVYIMTNVYEEAIAEKIELKQEIEKQKIQLINSINPQFFDLFDTLD